MYAGLHGTLLIYRMLSYNLDKLDFNLGKVLIITAKEKWLCAGHSDQLENHRYHQRHLTPENVTRDTVNHRGIQNARLSVQSSILGLPTLSPASVCCFPLSGPSGETHSIGEEGVGGTKL